MTKHFLSYGWADIDAVIIAADGPVSWDMVIINELLRCK